MFFHKHEHQLENNSHGKVVINLKTEYSQKDINKKEHNEKVVGHLHNKYNEKVINTKEHNEEVVDNIQTK